MPLIAERENRCGAIAECPCHGMEFECGLPFGHLKWRPATWHDWETPHSQERFDEHVNPEPVSSDFIPPLTVIEGESRWT